MVLTVCPRPWCYAWEGIGQQMSLMLIDLHKAFIGFLLLGACTKGSHAEQGKQSEVAGFRLHA